MEKIKKMNDKKEIKKIVRLWKYLKADDFKYKRLRIARDLSAWIPIGYLIGKKIGEECKILKEGY